MIKFIKNTIFKKSRNGTNFFTNKSTYHQYYFKNCPNYSSRKIHSFFTFRCSNSIFFSFFFSIQSIGNFFHWLKDHFDISLNYFILIFRNFFFKLFPNFWGLFQITFMLTFNLSKSLSFPPNHNFVPSLILALYQSIKPFLTLKKVSGVAFIIKLMLNH